MAPTSDVISIPYTSVEFIVVSSLPVVSVPAKTRMVLG